MEPIVIVSAAVVLVFAVRALKDAIGDLRQDGCWDAFISVLGTLLEKLRNAGSPSAGGWQLRRAPYYYSPYFHTLCPAARNKRRDDRPL